MLTPLNAFLGGMLIAVAIAGMILCWMLERQDRREDRVLAKLKELDASDGRG